MIKNLKTERLHQLLSHVQNKFEHYQALIIKLHEEQPLNTEKQKLIYEREINSLKLNLIEETREKNRLLYLKNDLEKLQEGNLL